MATTADFAGVRCVDARHDGFDDWLTEARAATEKRLSEILSADASGSAGAPAALSAAMRDAALCGGKRLRPALVFAVAGEINEKSLAAACAVELMHCYSLAHDDLPCMDDADSRRGLPSCHRAHGEALALLAGDCLQSLAFESAAAVSADACALLAKAAGAAGMGGGQALDVAGDFPDADSLAAMCRLKTGALFSCAVQLGLLCRARPPAADSADSAALLVYADEFGLLFQLANDIRGATADSAAGKKTYATVYPKEVRAAAAAAQDKAIAALDGRSPRLAKLAAAVQIT